jgi:hypothetical protein
MYIKKKRISPNFQFFYFRFFFTIQFSILFSRFSHSLIYTRGVCCFTRNEWHDNGISPADGYTSRFISIIRQRLAPTELHVRVHFFWLFFFFVLFSIVFLTRPILYQSFTSTSDRIVRCSVRRGHHRRRCRI